MVAKSKGRLANRSTCAELTLSSKRQITLPAAMARALGLGPGDRLVADLEDGAIRLRPRPESWVDFYAGIAEGMYGRTDEEIDAYIRDSRGEWEPLEE